MFLFVHAASAERGQEEGKQGDILHPVLCLMKAARDRSHFGQRHITRIKTLPPYLSAPIGSYENQKCGKTDSSRKSYGNKWMCLGPEFSAKFTQNLT